MALSCAVQVHGRYGLADAGQSMQAIKTASGMLPDSDSQEACASVQLAILLLQMLAISA